MLEDTIHEDIIVKHKNETSMHNDERFAQRCSWVRISCMKLSTAQQTMYISGAKKITQVAKFHFHAWKYHFHSYECLFNHPCGTIFIFMHGNVMFMHMNVSFMHRDLIFSCMEMKLHA